MIGAMAPSQLSVRHNRSGRLDGSRREKHRAIGRVERYCLDHLRCLRDRQTSQSYRNDTAMVGLKKASTALKANFVCVESETWYLKVIV